MSLPRMNFLLKIAIQRAMIKKNFLQDCTLIGEENGKTVSFKYGKNEN